MTPAIAFELTDAGWAAARAGAPDVDAVPYTLTDLGRDAAGHLEPLHEPPEES